MIKIVIDISNKSYIYTRKNQLIIDKNGAIIDSIPIEDIGLLILHHPAIIISQSAVVLCQQNNITLVFCDQRHIPTSVLFPLVDGHSLHQKILKQQIQSRPITHKRLWQTIVRQKIAEQASTLKLTGCDPESILFLKNKVKSGDKENHEAQAAQIYWKKLFGLSFKRDFKLSGINSMLNYGYAIIRAAIARAIVGTGLHPALGIHHHNQYNGLCLADDLMEPFRPWIDHLVYLIISEQNQTEIEYEGKKVILNLLNERVLFKNNTMPFMVASHHLASDLKRSLLENKMLLSFPQLESRGAK
jgi:CRISP-associated protein Cas1